MGKKLTPRQLAGRMNRKKRKGLSSDGREALRQAALSNRPWERSTGPRTTQGKARSRWNAYAHGERAAELLPEAFKAYAALVDGAEAIASRGQVFNREYRDEIHGAALYGSRTPHELLMVSRLTVRLIAAERRAMEAAGIRAELRMPRLSERLGEV